jgi:hypothetical protein
MTNGKHTQAALKPIREIPAEKLADKIKRTVTALFLGAAGIACVKWLGAPWWVAAIGCTLSAHIWSGELVEGSLRVIIGFFRDMVTAKKGDA